MNGIFSYYKMVFDDLGPSYFQPNHCADERLPSKSLQENSVNQNFAPLRPYSSYAFQVCASNSMIGEYSDVLITTTLPDSMYKASLPDLVEN